MVSLNWQLFKLSCIHNKTSSSKRICLFDLFILKCNIHNMYITCTVVPGPNDPLNECLPTVYDHFFIHRPLSHAIRPVMNDLLTNDLNIMTKTSHFTLFQWTDHKLTNYNKIDNDTVMFTHPKQRPTWAIKYHASESQAIAKCQLVENFDNTNNLLWLYQCFVVVLELENI